MPKNDRWAVSSEVPAFSFCRAVFPGWPAQWVIKCCLVTECCTHLHSRGCDVRCSTCPRCSYWPSLQLAQYWGDMLLCYGKWLWWYLPPLPKWQDLETKRALLVFPGIQPTEYIKSNFLWLVLWQKLLEATSYLWQMENLLVCFQVYYQQYGEARKR